MRAFLRKYVKSIRVVKAIVACLLGFMVISDIILVMLEKKNYPTFSWVIRDNRPTLIGLTFLIGGLLAKVFYNRKVNLKAQEWTGFLAFMSVVAMLTVLGHSIESIGYVNEFIILLCGGVVAHRIWPQYEG